MSRRRERSRLAGLAIVRRIAAIGTALSAGVFMASQTMTRIFVFMPARSARPNGPPVAIRAATLYPPGELVRGGKRERAAAGLARQRESV